MINVLLVLLEAQDDDCFTETCPLGNKSAL